MILSYYLKIKIYVYQYIHSVCLFSSTVYSIIVTVEEGGGVGWGWGWLNSIGPHYLKWTTSVNLIKFFSFIPRNLMIRL